MGKQVVDADAVADDAPDDAPGLLMIQGKIAGGGAIEGGSHILVKLNSPPGGVGGLLFQREMVPELIRILTDHLPIAERKAKEGEPDLSPYAPLLRH